MTVKAKTSKIIDAPKDIVWDVLDDYGNIANWSAGIEKSFTTGVSATGLGAERVCELGGKKKLQERITHYEPGEAMTINVFGVTGLPVKGSDTRFSVRANPDGTTEASIDAEMTPKMPGIVVKLMNGVIAGQVRKQFGGLLDELGTEAEQRARAARG